MPSWSLIVRFPFLHPHYSEYEQRCHAAHLSSTFIKDSWVLLIQGLERQAELKRHGAMNAPNPELLVLGEMVAASRKTLMTPPAMSAAKKMALWSGGLSVSEYVRGQGYDTLESTLYGGILDKMTNPTFKIWLGDKSWGPQGKVWNIISAEYVNVIAEIRDTMHVFMRTHDLESVFYREELVNWQKAKGKKPTEADGLTYHILVGMDSLKVEKVFNSEKAAKQYLLTFLGQVEQEFHKGMLKGGTNHRFRSEVWKDNERAFQDTFKKKSYDSYQEYIEAPLHEIVSEFTEATDEASPDQSFSTQRFADVMKELLAKRAQVN